MEEPDKTTTDAAFAEYVQREHALMAKQYALNAAELATTRELLAVTPWLLKVAEDEKFQAEAAIRIGKWRDNGKSWLLAIGAFIGVVTAIITAIKTSGG